MHSALIHAAVLKFDRLNKTLEKTEREHTEFRMATEEAMARATLPTLSMVSDLQAELEDVKISYLADGARLADGDVTVD